MVVYHSTIYSGQTVVVSYDQSAAGTDAIADADGNEVADFTTGQDGVPAVVNDSTQAAPSTLSALVVNDGNVDLTLTPTFVSRTTTYTAMVTAMTTNSGASIEYLDGDDATLADAGAAAGHQVAVAEGDNVIKVKVTASNGSTTKTYTVTVNRAAATDTTAPYDPNAGITMIDTNGAPLAGNPIRLTIRESTRGRYGFKLNTRPTSAVWVAGIQSNGDPDVLVLPSAEGAKAILPDEWETPFYVKIFAALDDDEENGERYFLNVSNSRDRNYHGLILPNVIVVEDDSHDDAGALSVADANATEGVDDTLDFVVKLNRRPSLGLGWEVTVDYRTRDGTATAGSDYTSTSGTLTFAPGEDKKTVSVPIMDDAVEDNGETFTLVLSNASDAGFASFGQGAVGTIRNTETTARPDLTASFDGVPAAHDGETAFTFRLAFSEAVAVTPEAMRTRVLTVTGGAVTGAARVAGASGGWAITVTPDSREELSITLAPAVDCAADGAVCTSDGRVPVERRGAHRERPGSRHGACAADGDVPGECLRGGTAQGTQRPPAGGGGVQRTGGRVRGGHAIGVGDRRVGGWRAAARQGGAGARVRVLPHPRGPAGDRLPASREPGLYRRRHLHGGPAAAEQQPLGDDPRSVGRRAGAEHGGGGRADDQRDAAGRGGAERLDVGHLRRRRAGRRELRLPVDPRERRH